MPVREFGRRDLPPYAQRHIRDQTDAEDRQSRTGCTTVVAKGRCTHDHVSEGIVHARLANTRVGEQKLRGKRKVVHLHLLNRGHLIACQPVDLGIGKFSILHCPVKAPATHRSRQSGLEDARRP